MFWDMHDTLFEHQTALTAPDLFDHAAALDLGLDQLRDDLSQGEPARRVQGDLAGGVRSGVDGTPAFFINGERFQGRDEDAFARPLIGAGGKPPQY